MSVKLRNRPYAQKCEQEERKNTNARVQKKEKKILGEMFIEFGKKKPVRRQVP
jgi:hypothetical protein